MGVSDRPSPARLRGSSSSKMSLLLLSAAGRLAAGPLGAEEVRSAVVRQQRMPFTCGEILILPQQPPLRGSMCILVPPSKTELGHDGTWQPLPQQTASQPRVRPPTKYVHLRRNAIAHRSAHPQVRPTIVHFASVLVLCVNELYHFKQKKSL